MRTMLVAIFSLVVAATVAHAGKRQVKYVGIHPIPKAAGGGFCHIEGPHVHVFGANKLEYRDHRGHQHFVGDPVAYGYDGPRHAYKGHHPIHVHAVVGVTEPDVEYCYLNGPHYHYFTPPPGPEFKVVGDTYFYVVADPPAAYVEARPAYVEINAMYTPIVYARPVVEVEPPSGWIGVHARWGVGMAVVAPGVVVRPPRAHVHTPGVSVDVHVPMPSVHVDVGVGIGGGVVVGGHPGRGHYKHRHHKHKKWKHKKHKKRRW